jgi:hypothetical protein
MHDGSGRPVACGWSESQTVVPLPAPGFQVEDENEGARAPATSALKGTRHTQAVAGIGRAIDRLTTREMC